MTEADYTQLTREEMIERLSRLEKLAESFAVTQKANTSSGPWIVSLGNWYLNPKTSKIVCSIDVVEALGYTEDDLRPDEEIDALAFRQMIHPEDLEELAKSIQKLITGSVQNLEISYRIKTKNGKWLWFYSKGHVSFRYKDGSPELVTGITFDITEQKRVEDLLHYQDTIITELQSLDPMTRTHTRKIIKDWLAQKIADHDTNASLCVLMLGIDDFRKVNQLHGHAVGDEVLYQVVGIINKIVGANNPVGRCNGTEFAVLLSDCTLEVSDVMTKICSEVAQTTFANGVRITMSGGFHHYTKETVDELIEAAARHMYEMSLGHTGS